MEEGGAGTGGVVPVVGFPGVGTFLVLVGVGAGLVGAGVGVGVGVNVGVGVGVIVGVGVGVIVGVGVGVGVSDGVGVGVGKVTAGARITMDRHSDRLPLASTAATWITTFSPSPGHMRVASVPAVVAMAKPLMRTS